MAVTENNYTGNGATVLYSFTFPYLETTDIKVNLDGVATTAYTLANATTIQFNTAPANGVAIRIYRETNIENLVATFFAGSAIRAVDLNNNATQALYFIQETFARALSTFGGTLTGILNMGGFKITNLGTPTAPTDAATKGYIDGVALAAIPDGDKGDITTSSSSTVWTIDNDVITDIKVSPTAAISGTKITPHFGNQHIESSAYIAAKDHAEVRFYEDDTNGNQHVGFRAPTALAGNVTWTLPAVDTAVSGYALVSNGSGTLSWGRAGGATGGGTDDVFYENNQTVTTSYTLTASKNAVTAGPITINGGITVTIPSGSSWSIV